MVAGTMSRPLAFVWFYWAAGAAGDELRWSIRSVCSFYKGTALPIVVGDRPEWYSGVHIDYRRIEPVLFRRYHDTLNKLCAACAHDAVPDEFIWMMDDSFWLRPFDHGDAARPRHCGLMSDRQIEALRNGNRWSQLKHRTFTALRQRGHATYDYATPHSPQHVTKANVLSLFENWDFSGQPLIWNLLYGNLHYAEQKLPTDEIYWVARPRRLEEIRAGLRPEFRILNSASSAWNAGLRLFLAALLPDRAPAESRPGAVES